MKLQSTLFKSAVTVSLILLNFTTVQAQCFSVGTGADGAYSATSNTTLPGGTYNYTTFNINSGVVVNVTGTQPLMIYCTGAVTINGGLRANGGNGTDGVTFSAAGAGGIGVGGGGNGGNGSYSSSAGPLPGVAGSGLGGVNNQGDAWSGGGGGGYAAVGGSSGNGAGGFGGPVYGNANISGYEAGSGGGGGSGGYSCGSGGGGAGGGMIYIVSGVSITISATGAITCNGGNGGSDGTGNCGGGAGGSGGSIWLSAVSMTNNGVISCNGGTGGASAVPGNPYYGTGSNGSTGRIRLDYNGTLSGTGTTSPAVGAHFTVTGPMTTAISPVSNVSCFGGSNGSGVVTANGGTPAYTYSWAPSGGTASLASGLSAGTYTCTITDAVGCVQTQTVTITQPPALIATISSQNVSCNGGADGTAAVTVNGGTPGYSYNWTPSGGSGATTSGLSIGTYTCTISDFNGCFVTQSVTITEPPVLVGNIVTVVSPTTCGGTDGSIDINTTGGTGPYLFFWNTMVAAEDLLGIPAGVYFLSITDANGCTGSVTVPVSDPANPAVTLVLNTGVVCQTTQAPFALTGGLPAGGTYSGPGVTAGMFDPMQASLGYNVITYSYTDPNTNCTGSYLDSIMVDICAGIISMNSGAATIYPNPNAGQFTLQLSTIPDSPVLIEIVDALGQKVLSFTMTESSRQIDLGEFSNGVYLLRMIDGNTVSVYRMISNK